jgi:hypothetical protein
VSVVHGGRAVVKCTCSHEDGRFGGRVQRQLCGPQLLRRFVFSALFLDVLLSCACVLCGRAALLALSRHLIEMAWVGTSSSAGNQPSPSCCLRHATSSGTTR